MKARLLTLDNCERIFEVSDTNPPSEWRTVSVPPLHGYSVNQPLPAVFRYHEKLYKFIGFDELIELHGRSKRAVYIESE